MSLLGNVKDNINATTGIPYGVIMANQVPEITERIENIHYSGLAPRLYGVLFDVLSDFALSECFEFDDASLHEAANLLIESAASDNETMPNMHCSFDDYDFALIDGTIFE